jgi:hypothetical protein
MIRVLVVLLVLAIVFSLFSGLISLYRDRGTGTRTVRLLTWRVGLSIALFVLLMLAFRFGFIAGYTQ